MFITSHDHDYYYYIYHQIILVLPFLSYNHYLQYNINSLWKNENLSENTPHTMYFICDFHFLFFFDLFLLLSFFSFKYVSEHNFFSTLFVSNAQFNFTLSSVVLQPFAPAPFSSFIGYGWRSYSNTVLR